LFIFESEGFEMDDRRRTISSEEQMIGEALMRVSNTLEAQRLTKSLDYQEKLRSRSNIRLIIAIICLFVAMMMMVISGALLFILWRYADPILDTVMPFLKGMMGDFGVIWDGLVESLSYVPVMVEQLTRLLEQVIIMLEGINRIDLAGMMGYLSQMLGGLMTMMDDLRAALKPMMEAIGRMLQTLSLEGLDGIIEDLFGPEAASSIKELMAGMFSLMAGTGKTLGALGEGMADLDMSAMMKGMQDMMTVGGETMSTLAASLADMDLSNMINGMMAMMDAGGQAMSDMAEALSNMDLSEMMEGMETMMNGMGNAMGSMGQAMEVVGDTISQNVENGNIEKLINAMDQAMGEIGDGISGNIKAEDISNLIQNMGVLINGMSNAAGAAGNAMNQLADILGSGNIIDIIRALLGG
ncbi:MAG: hypothetical protein J5782_00030, partial [Clostridia bacterium]|nr:hypothetical protein [Clostridia bacterium]